MKISHLADLHLGKSVNNFSMIEEQQHILEEILEILAREQVTTVMMAGDIYDRSVPSIEATNLLNWFLAQLNQQHYEVFIIAGNHDSGDRLGFGSALFDQMHIHIAGNYDGHVCTYEMKDEYGPIVFHLLPFIRPIHVNRYIEEEEDKVGTYTEAIHYVLSKEDVDINKRNIILSHQFVTGTQMDENGSEEIIVGGLDQVSAAVYDNYDYVCLGHIHRPQTVSRETMVYSGTPLKYSFSEVNQEKHIPILDFHEKGNIKITYIPLHPIHEMKEIKGMFSDVMNMPKSEDYMHVILTDELDVPDAMSSLRQVFPNAMSLTYDNKRTQAIQETETSAKDITRSPMEIFTSFYEERNHAPISDEQKKIMDELIHNVF